jgi:ABC-type multidrug transport system fused ATPase/permease subunit
VLQDVDLELAPGTITALVGASGSGKSTIARLLLRFADPCGGAIRCGERDLRECDVALWREQVAWVPQHPTLFTGTLADNVRLGAPDASDDQVLAALRAAGAQGLIASLPDGLATAIGETGRRISAGQRQRVAVARAFLRNAALLILDEPTAHLDQDTAESVGDAIERLALGRTTLLIVHDDALAARADRIVTIVDGQIVSAAPGSRSRVTANGHPAPTLRLVPREVSA